MHNTGTVYVQIYVGRKLRKVHKYKNVNTGWELCITNAFLRHTGLQDYEACTYKELQDRPSVIVGFSVTMHTIEPMQDMLHGT